MIITPSCVSPTKQDLTIFIAGPAADALNMAADALAPTADALALTADPLSLATDEILAPGAIMRYSTIKFCSNTGFFLQCANNKHFLAYPGDQDAGCLFLISILTDVLPLF